MAKYRAKLPQLGDKPFLTDSGLETTLIFHDGIDLPHLASITLHATEAGEQRSARLFRAPHRDREGAQNAASFWKARPGAQAPTGARSSASRATQLADLNRKSIALLASLCATNSKRRNVRCRSAAISVRAATAISRTR